MCLCVCLSLKSVIIKSNEQYQRLGDKDGLQGSLFELSGYWIIMEVIISAEWRPWTCWLDLDCILENSHFYKVG